MRHVKSTQEIAVGDIILTGSTFYSVADVFPRKFRGYVWQEDVKAWGPLRDVPLPSPIHSAHVMEESAEMFPPIPGGTRNA